MILTIRTDNPDAELGLHNDKEEKSYLKWRADRNLSSDIHKKIDELFAKQGIDYSGLSGVIIYKGPGSFTGLRIGFSVANTIANELDIPIAALGGEKWINDGLKILKSEPGRRTVLPYYGSEPKTTKPKK
jgi:tRNA threonylcarbamoyladenosine biosynthesis protein TsaB